MLIRNIAKDLQEDSNLYFLLKILHHQGKILTRNQKECFLCLISKVLGNINPSIKNRKIQILQDLIYQIAIILNLFHLNLQLNFRFHLICNIIHLKIANLSLRFRKMVLEFFRIYFLLSFPTI